jgi:hypothetical protein
MREERQNAQNAHLPEAANDSAVPMPAAMIVRVRFLFLVPTVHKMMLLVQGKIL